MSDRRDREWVLVWIALAIAHEELHTLARVPRTGEPFTRESFGPNTWSMAINVLDDITEDQTNE